MRLVVSIPYDYSHGAKERLPASSVCKSGEGSRSETIHTVRSLYSGQADLRMGGPLCLSFPVPIEWSFLMPKYNIQIQVAGHIILDVVEAQDPPHAVRILNEMGIRDGEYELPSSVVAEAEAMVRESNRLTHG
tara:strand:+ start:5989 stop:6387 length:399 start_codon:yes stop_codon:yes gene_type:complete